VLPAQLDPAAAAAAGPSLAAAAVQRSPRAFATAGALRTASERLRAAVAAEAAAEGADSVTHVDWRQAHDRLLAAASTVTGEGDAVARLRALLGRWADPYACDAAGGDLLQLVIASCGDGHEVLRRAAEGALRAGQARDRAEAARARGITARVEATRQWRAAAEALFAVSPPPDTAVLAVLARPEEGGGEEDWFTD